MDTNHESTIAMFPDHKIMPFQKGQSILYEGKVARVIRLRPLFTIKVEDRVICGALQTLVDAVNE